MASGSAGAQTTERRVALVVGNSAYQNATRLLNPANDARDMKQRLEHLGFEVVDAVDANVDSFDSAVNTFERKLIGADLAVFFYAGHGLQFNGVNYLLPVDVRVDSDTALKRRAVTAQDVIDRMERLAKVSLVFLDACRNNSLLRDLQQSLPERTRDAAGHRGLARMDARGNNTLIAFATAPNEVAADGTGRNSPFTSALLAHIETPGISVPDMLTAVSSDVLAATRNQQKPEVLSRLSTRVVLNAIVEKPHTPPLVVPPVAPSLEREASFAWDAVKASCQTAELSAFTTRYGNTFFGDLAKARVADIDSRRICVIATPAKKPEPPITKGEPAQSTIETPPPLVDDEAFVRAVQTELTRTGCLDGEPDGKWGAKSKAALVRLLGLAETAPELMAAHLPLAKAKRDNSCSQVCELNEILVYDRCVAKPKPVSLQPSKNRVPEPRPEVPKVDSDNSKSLGAWGRTAANAGYKSCRQVYVNCKYTLKDRNNNCDARYSACQASGCWKASGQYCGLTKN